MVKSSNSTNRKGGPVVSITSVGEAGGVPLDGTLLESASLEEAVENAIGQMDWLQATDRAMVELALSYARQIDMANFVALDASERLKNLDPDMEPEDAKAFMDTANRSLAAAGKALYLGPHLHNAMRSLGGDPASRKEITGAGSGAAEAPADPLAAMRAKRRGA